MVRIRVRPQGKISDGKEKISDGKQKLFGGLFYAVGVQFAAVRGKLQRGSMCSSRGGRRLIGPGIGDRAGHDGEPRERRALRAVSTTSPGASAWFRASFDLVRDAPREHERMTSLGLLVPVSASS